MSSTANQIDMANLEQNLQKRQTLLKKFEAFKKLRSICARFETYYYREGNIKMKSVMEERFLKAVNEIERLSIELKPLNEIARAEYQKTDVHNFLMNSKRMNGRDILIKTTLSKNDMLNLTSPTL